MHNINMRINNVENAILTQLLFNGHITVPQICALVNRPKSSVSRIILNMANKGWIETDRTLPIDRGRPISTYRMKWSNPLAVFQLDGSQLAGAVYEADQSIKALEVVSFVAIDNPGEAMAHMKQLLARLLQKAEMFPNQLQGLALQVNATHIAEKTFTSPILPWIKEVKEEDFSERLGIPVNIFPGLTPIPEYQKLQDPKPQSITRLNIADGVSAHTILYGRLNRGSAGRAGELGHVIVDPAGPLCGCGRRGCLEALCSGRSISQRILTELKTGVVTSLKANINIINTLPPRDIMEYVWLAWQQGDTYVRAVMDQVLGHLAWGLGLVINLDDPDVIVAGGYVLKNKPDWLEILRQKVSAWAIPVNGHPIDLRSSQSDIQDELRVIACNYFGRQILGSAFCG